MVRTSLLITGCILVLLQQFVISVNNNVQFIIFITGILLLGVPHGAADLLVANKNADTENKAFSKIRFLLLYLTRLFLFAGILWFFPIAGNILFILFAAYHFGETDLYQFKTNTLLGKLFVVAYGLVILSVILLHHFEEVIPIFQLFPSGMQNTSLLNWINENRYLMMSITGILFFTTTFIYFLRNPNLNNNEKGQFLIRLAVILVILFNLPMLLGFSFYFVIWHSVISLQNIVGYLRIDNRFTQKRITQQIFFYSAIAIMGIGLFGLTGFMFMNNSAIAGYIFLGLAVLTAPHMQIMHDMYTSIRRSSSL